MQDSYPNGDRRDAQTAGASGEAVIGTVSETAPGERRAAIVPETVARFTSAGFGVLVQSGVGAGARFTDRDYEEAGARVAESAGAVASEADVLVQVQPPGDGVISSLKEGAIVVSFLHPAAHGDVVSALARRRVTAFGLDLLPRISRAQSMDALSSQASVAGYMAALIAAARLPKFFPMLTTAAGTIPPAKVLVLGAGVAGLQSIATARRLGAVVEAYDVRAAAKEEVESLGARFVELPLEAQEGAGGYAREQSEEFLARQRELIAERVAASDAVITTAAVPGRKAPVLVTSDMVAGMRPGSVIVDLAAESGGNCELSIAGEEVEHAGVLIYGARNLPSAMATHASQLYARNVANFVLDMASEGRVGPDFDDPVVEATCLTHDGAVVHPDAKAAAS